MTRIDAATAARCGVRIPRTSEHEESFAADLWGAGLRAEREFAFHPTRKWRFDFAFPRHRVAVEIEGGVFPSRQADGELRAGHTRPLMFEKDAEKYAEAAILGWCVLRMTPKMVNDGRALDFLLRALAAVAERRGIPTRTHDDD